jgi:type IV secretory pathway VirJ component
MRHHRFYMVLLVAFFCGTFPCMAQEETLHFGRFGNTTLYRQSDHPSHVVIFVSGDGGWNLGVVDMAKKLSTLNALVVGIDIVHYLKLLENSSEKCSYPASDFEALSKYVQKKLNFPRYIQPVLIGYSSGAALVYAVLAQAPANTFQGAVSLGFCPDLPLTKPLCRGSGLEWEKGPKGKGYIFLPVKKLQAPWIVFQGTIDQVCKADLTQAYVKQVNGAMFVLLPGVGHGFSVSRNWMPQFTQAFKSLVDNRQIAQTSSSGNLANLPLIELPAKESGISSMAVILSGDGGWAGIDRELGNVFAENGVSVVGLNSLSYFWKERTPEEAAKDLERILRHYLALWKKENAVLVGYSLGADVLPFLADRLSGETLAKVRLIALLGPGTHADFTFHLTDWMGGASKTARPVLPEVKKLKAMEVRMLCFYGEQETESFCSKLDPNLAQVVSIKGAHHFGGNYLKIAERILKEIK